jgi:N-sulfoglucosamine sulfohydrolase
VTDFVSTTDLAPTFLEACGVAVPTAMTGKSWMNIFKSTDSGRIDPTRDHVLTGKERHVPCQEGTDSGGTPMRAIRTDQYLLIHNYRPDRWPAGTPNYNKAYIRGCWLGDCDNGPTKTYMVENRNKDEEHQRKYELAFGKRPEFELFDLNQDPDQLKNVADQAEYAEVKSQLAKQLKSELASTSDPRETGADAEQIFDKPDYFGSGPRHPSTQATKKKKTKQ